VITLEDLAGRIPDHPRVSCPPVGVLWHPEAMRWLHVVTRVVLLLPVVLTCGGCFEFSTVVTVQGDGSGTIEQRVLFTPAALAQIRGLAVGGRAEPPAFDLLSEQQARARVTAFGTGVRYVSSTPIDTTEGRGRDVTYAFTDISHIRLDEQPPVLGGVSSPALDIVTSPVSFVLTRESGGNALLRLNVPRPAMPGRSVPQGPVTQIPPDQMAMLRQLFTGARLSIAVEPAGELVRTSSPYVDGRRVTLIEVDIDDLLMDGGLLLRLQAARTLEDVEAALQDVPGAKVCFDPEITIEFTPAQ